ncbi:MAG: cation diffusion facilitator family transporter [Spirochaetaceae bacterium]
MTGEQPRAVDNHEPQHAHAHDDPGAGGFRVAFFLNLVFTLVEFVGGMLTNSVAILADAVHDLGDSVSLLFSWSMERISRRPRTDRQTFGYKRYSVLGAVVSAAVLLLGSVFVLMEAVPRLFDPEPVLPEGMIPLAVAGVGFNLAAVLRLRRGGKLNHRVVLLHLLEDVLGWIGVFVVGVVMLFADVPVLDPILSVAVTVFVLSRIVPRLRSALGVFLQYAPSGIALGHIEEEVKAFPQVLGVHDLHVWSLDGSYNLLSTHVVVDENMSLGGLEELKARIKERLAGWDIHHVTLEFEPESASCVECEL